MSDPDNGGLDIPIKALRPVVTKYVNSSSSSTTTPGLSRADIWALAAMAGTEISQPANSDPFLEFPLYYHGRIDCDAEEEAICVNKANEAILCSETTDSYHRLPPPDMATHELLEFFANAFSFSTRETVVAMGAHTLGVAQREHSGFDGPVGWVDGRNTLDNEYYQQLVGGGSPQSSLDVLTNDALFWGTEMQNNQDLGTTNRFVWVRRSVEGGDNIPLIMLTSDIALVRDLDGHIDPDNKAIVCSFRNFEGCRNVCPHAEQTLRLMAEFKHDNSQWIREFRAVLSKMFTTGYSTRSDCDALQKNCLQLVDENVTWPPSPSPTNQPTLTPTAGAAAIITQEPSEKNPEISTSRIISIDNLLPWTIFLLTIAVSI